MAGAHHAPNDPACGPAPVMGEPTVAVVAGVGVGDVPLSGITVVGVAVAGGGVAGEIVVGAAVAGGGVSSLAVGLGGGVTVAVVGAPCTMIWPRCVNGCIAQR